MHTGNEVLYGHFNEQHVTIARGQGVHVYDAGGKRYLDAVGGVCVVNIGRGVQEIVDVMTNRLAP